MLNSILIFLNLGGGEVFMVVLFILLFFGSDKLPELAKGLGKGLREINDARNQIQNEITKGTEGLKEELEKHTAEIQSEIIKAGESMRRQIDDAAKSIDDEGKTLEDTMK
ncbi:MAG: twin-arginine translocase TatA/TatE family subunit [Bacteroidia bacterium]